VSGKEGGTEGKVWPLFCTAQQGREGMCTSVLHGSAEQRKYVYLCSARLSRAEKVCVPLFCMAQQGREGMRTSVLAIVPRLPRPSFVACSTKSGGKAWKDLSRDVCYC